MWKSIEGYKFPYRINEDGVVQVYKKKYDEWIEINKFYRGNHVYVYMRDEYGDQKQVSVPGMMREAFGNTGTVPCRKCISKIDRHGHVLETYTTIKEAADKNYMSTRAVADRCKNKIQKPFYAAGFSFRYEFD